MLKKIQIDQLRLGMHVHRLCGSWLNHPFWRAKFLLRDPQDLAKLRASGVLECWIDIAKGLDVEAPPADVPTEFPPEQPAAPLVVSQTTRTVAPRDLVRRSIDEEVGCAAILRGQAGQVVEGLFGQARLGRALDTESSKALVQEIVGSVSRNPGALVSLSRLKTLDDYTYEHSVAVCALMVSLALQLGLDEDAVCEAGLAGLVHDIGKASVPVDLLHKPGPLTESEYALIKTHAERGYELLEDAPGVSQSILDACLHHHERPDGLGYPDRLAGDGVSLYAKMSAVCDVYDAITSNRPYKDAWNPAESIARMAEWTQAGQFDPTVFKALVRAVGIYPIGSLVRLRSGRLAVVTEQNPGALAAPRVKVFFSTRTEMPLPLEVIDLSRTTCIDSIVDRESNASWGFPYLPQLETGHELLKRRTRPAGL